MDEQAWISFCRKYLRDVATLQIPMCRAFENLISKELRTTNSGVASVLQAHGMLGGNNNTQQQQANNDVNALRAKKYCNDLTDSDRVTPIYYNGRSKHNDDIKTAIDRGLIKYPKSLFYILSVHSQNTIAQTKHFSLYLQSLNIK